ncbi:hypothetical protein GF377_03855 [candidate division GN15 bacterium]|nr:hypothetical protein [candidate division GN15 bacterium]
MAETEKKGASGKRVSEEQRLHYIGFDVFPGKPKDLFKNKAEQDKLVEEVVAKRQKGETLREHNTLMDERVTMGEKILLAVASLAIFAALFLPWYSAYTEIPIEPETTGEVMYRYEVISQAGNSAVVVTEHRDSVSLWAISQELRNMPVADDQEPIYEAYYFETSPPPEVVPAESDLLYASWVFTPGNGEQALALADPAGEWPTGQSAPMAEDTEDTAPAKEVVAHQGEGANEEIITGHVRTAQLEREYTMLSGFGTFGAVGTVGSYVFSSGFVLMISAILMLLYAVLCVGLPVLNLYALFGMKGKPDDVAMKLKRILRLNWLPLIVIVVVMAMSFFGADYGFDTTDTFASIGDEYGVGALFNTLSWGAFASMAAAVVVAVKAIEI